MRLGDLTLGAVAVLLVLVLLAMRNQRQNGSLIRPAAPTFRRKAFNPLIRRLPLIEAIGTAIASGILYFVLGKHELAEFFAVAGSLLALGRLSYTAELEKEIRELQEPLERIGDYFDLSSQANLDIFRKMLQIYGKITEDEFVRVKDGILAGTMEELVYLANTKKSKVLATTEYYGWLLPMVEKATPPQRIWALSLMRDLEWDDSPPERRLIEFSRKAAESGVGIDRVFVMKKANIGESLKNEAIRLHFASEKPANLRGYVVDEEALNKSDEELHARLGDGFLAFVDRVAMVDVFSKGARGYVTMNQEEITHLRNVFDRLMILAEDLDSVASRHAAADRKRLSG